MSEHIEVSNMSILPLSVVGVNNLTVYTLWDAADENNPSGLIDWGCGVYIDGIGASGYATTFSTNLVPTVAGINQFNIAVGGGSHQIDLWSSLTVRRRGNFVVGYSADTGKVTVRKMQPATRRMVVYCDSIACGETANPATQNSYISRLRRIYPGRIAMIGWGWRALWDDAGQIGSAGYQSINATAARIVACANIDNPATREVLLAIGTNDATLLRPNGVTGYWSSANFGIQYAALVDAIHSLDPAIKIFCLSPIFTNLEATNNSFGETPAPYRTQIATIAAARPTFCTNVLGTSVMAVGGLDAFGIHPTNAGHQAIFDGTGGQGGATNLRAVIGV